MRVTIHRPLLLAPGTGDAAAMEGARRCLHAALWLSVALEPWRVRRSGHLQMVREPASETWREVDLSRHPLRPAHAVAEPDAEVLRAELRQALSLLPLRFYRIPDLGLVSEIGEGRDDFRRRAVGGLRPEVQRRVAPLAGEPPTRLPWKRRAAERRLADAKAGLASQLAALIGSMETLELPDLAAHVSRAEVGLLLVAPELELEPPAHRSLML
jgi:hypothetical protein